MRLDDEALNVTLVAESKGFSLASLRGPVHIAGTFKSPTVRPDIVKVVARGALAAAAGAATAGIGALIPLLEFGHDHQENNCAPLISQAKADVGVKSSDLAQRAPHNKP